jgi:glycerol-3-phosphate acyltransferase PlsY
MRVAVLGFLLTVLLAYLLGSIPTGFLFGKAKGIDIRSVGSGNIGATNVVRILGKGAGTLVLLADAAKGWLAVMVVAKLVSDILHMPTDRLNQQWLSICAGTAAILGHNFTCWLRFKGGKGIATSAGALLALVPLPLLIIFVVWAAVFGLTRFVSLASICAAVALPFACWVTAQGTALILVTAVLALLAVYKHKANIQRLVQGTESRLSFKKLPRLDAPNQTP